MSDTVLIVGYLVGYLLTVVPLAALCRPQPHDKGHPMSEKAQVPSPGSPEAGKQGCVCPVYDNAHGRGYLGGVTDKDGKGMFVHAVGCPLHDPEWKGANP